MRVAIKPKALKDLRALPKSDAARIAGKLKELESGLQGDIKRLTNFTPEYRLRVGDYRILFEAEGTQIVVYRVMHRKDVYAKR